MKILFVCSANVDRSPTAEKLYNGRYGIEARSAGVKDYATHKITLQDLDWADKVIAMDKRQKDFIIEHFSDWWNERNADFELLGIPDKFKNGESVLVDKLRQRIDPALKKLGIAIQ